MNFDTSFNVDQIFVRSKPSRRSIVSNIEFTMVERSRHTTPLSYCDLSTDIEEVETVEKPRTKKLTKLMKKSWSKSLTRGLRLKRKISSKMSSKSKIHETLTPANAPCTTTQRKVILKSNQEELAEDVVIWEEKYYARSKSVLAFL